MKRTGAVTVTLVGVSILAVACGSSKVSTTPAQQPSATGAPSTTSTPSTPSAPSAQKAGVGDTIRLSDAASGKNVAVTVVRVVDQDSSTNPVETPSAGDRFESIQFRIVNTGTGSYQDDPLVEIAAKDAAGQNMQQAIVTSTAAGAQMPSSVSLAPGDTALGYVTFDVPVGDKIAQAQYSLNGLLSATGEWQIGNGQTLAPTPTPTPPPTTSPAAPPAAPTTTAPPPATTSGSNAQTVVEQYFAAINAHNYALAWALGGKNIEGGSFDAFVKGFATTSTDHVTIVSTSGDTVAITLDATQTDGTHKFFAGTYTVANGEIVAADIH